MSNTDDRDSVSADSEENLTEEEKERRRKKGKG